MNGRLPKHDIILLGAGHTNAHVLRMWRMDPIPGARLTCVSNFSLATYSGMLPGTLAGFYEPEQMQIDLVRLCAATGARLMISEVVGLDVERRELQFADRPPLHFDVLSIGIGSVPKSAGNIELAPDHDEANRIVVPIKPMQTFLPRLERRLEAVRETLGHRPLRIATVGAGVAGIEIVLCLRQRLRKTFGDVRCELMLIDRRSEVAHGMTPSAAEKIRAELNRRGVERILGHEVRAVNRDAIELDDGRHIPLDVVLWATSAAAPETLGRFGLPTDEQGFLLVRPTLQTVADAPVFAVGDSGTDALHPHPKAGVYAVRQGPVLWENLRRLLRGETLREYVPQQDFLKLLCTGDGRGVISYKGFAAHARWCWRLKDWIDRRFMAKYQSYEPMAMADHYDPPTAETMRCAGCGGKLGGAVLKRVLDRLDRPESQSVLVGLDRPDDAAVVRLPEGRDVVATVDFFSAFIDDPYTLGRIAALNAASDLFAMGTRPLAALALATLPVGPEPQQERLLFDLLAGAIAEFSPMEATLVGGHTIEGPRVTIGFSLLAEAQRSAVRLKGGLRPGDVLLLTKPLGTGVLLAAHMQARCRAAWFERLVETMLVSNEPPGDLYGQFDIQGATDVTGFGLAGHLLEMLEASGAAAELRLADLPVLPGAEELAAEGTQSTLAPANRAAEANLEAGTEVRASVRFALLFDPQTSGGLLLGVPETHVESARRRLHQKTGIQPAVIGQVDTTHPERRSLRIL